jgi:hypothetical protein
MFSLALRPTAVTLILSKDTQIYTSKNAAVHYEDTAPLPPPAPLRFQPLVYGFGPNKAQQYQWVRQDEAGSNISTISKRCSPRKASL